MDQHPVPQNISSYEFRLVGDMTLKQFFQLAGGIALGFMFTKLPLPVFIKWPLAGLAALVGVMLAFVPVSGRPFSQWLLAFIHAIYSPTEYIWKETPAEAVEVPTSPTPTTNLSPLDKLETQVVSRITQLFTNTIPTAPQPLPVTPVNVTAPVAPTPAPQPTQTVIHETPKPAPESAGEMQAKKPIMVAEVVDMPVAPKPQPVAPAPAPVPVTNPNPISVIPQVSQAVAQPAMTTDLVAQPPWPNIIAGLVVNAAGQPVEGVIVEISDVQKGIPVRALRSNKLGQFQTATQLSRGSYNINADKEGLSFSPVSMVCDDKPVKPLLIKANA